MNYEAIVLDTETTDVEDLDVIELAWASFHLSIDALCTRDVDRFRPSKRMSFAALATHHILESDLYTCPPSTQAPEFVPAAEYWIGHNVDFDWKALGQPRGVKRICTLAMCRSIWPKADAHNLVAMTYFLEGATPETRAKVRGAHGAAADIVLCESVLRRIINDEGFTTFFDLYQFSEECRIPKIMSFGKFKGQPVSDVDRGWANWYQRQEDTDPYLMTALRRARKL